MAKRASLAESVKRAGATESNGAETVKVTFELDKVTYKRLARMAFDADKSNRKVLTEAVDDYLAKHTTAKGKGA